MTTATLPATTAIAAIKGGEKLYKSHQTGIWVEPDDYGLTKLTFSLPNGTTATVLLSRYNVLDLVKALAQRL